MVTRFDKHSGKIAFAFWFLVIIFGIAILEWSLAPANGRYRAYGSASGPGPQRSLALREWEPLTDYRFLPLPERLRYPNGGIRQAYELKTDANGFIEPAVRHERPHVTIALLVDLARARDWSFGDVYDAVHFTDEGSRKVAEVIAAKLSDEIAKRNATPRADERAGR